MFVAMNKMDEMYFHLIGTNDYRVMQNMEDLLPAHHKFEDFTSSFGRLRQKNCTKKRAACAARLLFLIQPIKSLICGVVIGVVVS